MTAVSPNYSTVDSMRTKVRRLTSSSSESSLTTQTIDRALNTVINQDFPYAIKLDQMRSVYTFFTEANRDRYPIDVNYNQGVRAPLYVDGVQGYLYKDRQSFFNMWPYWPSRFTPISGNGVQVAYTFTLPGPFLSGQVTLGGTDASGNPISVSDDGNGNLQLEVPNPVVSVPGQAQVYTIADAPVPALVGKPIPGMKNLNTLNPGLNRVNTQTGAFTYIGTVNYVTGLFNIEFPVAPASGTTINVFISQYQTGRPYSLLFWNNELIIRPIPKLCHKITFETYLTPVSFMETTDVPILNQWWQYISYVASMEILRERNDFAAVEALREGMMRQEGLVLERQGVEEINTRNATIFSAPQQTMGGNSGWNQSWWY